VGVGGCDVARDGLAVVGLPALHQPFRRVERERVGRGETALALARQLAQHRIDQRAIDDLQRDRHAQPALRRRGIGRRLVDWLMESAVIAGMASVHLELRADNEAARRFYRALGFSETLLMPKYYNGRETAMRMIRVLRAPGPLPLAWRPPVLGKK